jgi:ribokinase
MKKNYFYLSKHNSNSMKSTILVAGSSNTDMVIKADHLPGPGETILGGVFFMNPGGKGANQAVAAARLGGNVTFICKTGNDIFGRQSLQLFEDEGIDTSYMVSDPRNPSGVALITVDKNAENCIVVASGANAELNPGDLAKAKEAIESAVIVLMQLEIPLETVEYVAQIAAKSGVKVVLNPAPARELPDELLRNISVITPNKTEAEMLSGIAIDTISSAKEAATIIRNKGVDTVIITLGKNGALVLHNNEFSHIPALKVDAVDTTAAGDVFNGALTVALSEDKDILEATAFACKAAAISVTRLGAQASAPFKKEADSFVSVEQDK